MSAIVEIIDDIEENFDVDHYRAVRARAARAELAQLRADLAAAQRERDELMSILSEIRASTYMPDGSRLSDEFTRVMRERDEARARVAELEADAATLIPRRCVTCAQEAAREMRDKCMDKCRVILESNGAKYNESDGAYLAASDIMCDIDSIELPSCGGCNPLKPEAENEATR